MNSPPRILAFLPTLNDFAVLPQICAAIQALPGDYAVLVIDDGSFPPLDRATLPAGTMVGHLPENYGLGVATHVAMDHMLAHGYDVLVRLDSDGQHPVDKIPLLVDELTADRADFAIGTRIDPHKGFGARILATRFISAYYRLIARWLTGSRVLGDLTSGFMAMNRRTASLMAKEPLERYPEPEILMLGMLEGLRIARVPIKANERESGRSTIGVNRAMLLFYRFNIFALSRLFDGAKRP